MTPINKPEAEVLDRRSILLSARTRFSPIGAGTRHEAIDALVEQHLAALPGGVTVSAEDLHRSLTAALPGPTLAPQDSRSALERLVEAARVTRVVQGGSTTFRLSDERRREAEGILAESNRRLESVVADLFLGGVGADPGYREAFTALLCRVFTHLGSLYAQVICEQVKPGDMAGHQVLLNAIDETLAMPGSVLNAVVFRTGVIRFFAESTPPFDAIKWNFAQNFYLARVLGLDLGSRALSRDLLAGCHFYLDTNVLVAGLFESHWHHKSLRMLVDACRTIDVRFVVVGITARELGNVVAGHAQDLRRVFGKIPRPMLSSVRSFLLRDYLAQREVNPSLTLEDFLAGAQTPIQSLEQRFGIRLEDDEWFEHEIASDTTLRCAATLARRYQELRGKPKSESAAVHDALLLRWVMKKARTVGGRCRLLSLDLSLPGVEITDHESRGAAPVVGLDALLQWASSVGITTDGEGPNAELYSHALTFALLPQSTFLKLADFRAFAEMDVETAQLPPSEVEECIRRIQALGPATDPGRAEDREKIGRVFQQFFADPSRKFQQQLQRLTDENAGLIEAQRQNEAALMAAREAAEKVSATARQQQSDLEALRGQLLAEQGARRDAHSRVDTLEAKWEERDRLEGYKTLKRSVVRRGVLLAVLLAGLWGVVAWVALREPAAATPFERLTRAWPWFGGAFAFVAALLPFVMGTQQMKTIRQWKGDGE